MENNIVIGHKKQRQRLEKLWKAQKIPSALMFTGSSGIGKSLVAKELFQTFFCERGNVYGGCKMCHSCHLFQAGNHPDFHERDFLDKEATTTESLRELLYSLNLGSFSGKARAILFHNSELISIQGANLLLKILEEPRPNTFFCLLSSNPSRLLPTILSRCHKWFFDKLSNSDIQAILQAKHFSSEVPNEDLIMLTDGTLENIDTIENNFSDWQYLKDGLNRCAAGDIYFANNFITELGKDRDTLRSKLRMLSLYAHACLLKATSANEKLRWSNCLTNLLDAEPMIFERNFGVNYILSLLFLDFTSNIKHVRLLHEIVV